MSQSKIYVGSLAYSVTKEELSSFFARFGAIKDAVVIIDRATGQSKGFGFVTFDSAESADAALSSNGQEINGRAIKVSLAKEDGERRSFSGPRGPRPSRGGFGGQSNGGGNRW